MGKNKLVAACIAAVIATGFVITEDVHSMNEQNRREMQQEHNHVEPRQEVNADQIPAMHRPGVMMDNGGRFERVKGGVINLASRCKIGRFFVEKYKNHVIEGAHAAKGRLKAAREVFDETQERLEAAQGRLNAAQKAFNEAQELFNEAQELFKAAQAAQNKSLEEKERIILAQKETYDNLLEKRNLYMQATKKQAANKDDAKRELDTAQRVFRRANIACKALDFNKAQTERDTADSAVAIAHARRNAADSAVATAQARRDAADSAVSTAQAKLNAANRKVAIVEENEVAHNVAPGHVEF